MQLTAREAAALLGMTERRIYSLIDAGDLPFYQVRDQYRFNQAELLEWAMMRRLPISRGFVVADDAARSAHGLAAALVRGGIYRGVEAQSREELLGRVVALLPLCEEDRELVLELLLAREGCGTTAVGDGIAIPHVRSPIVCGTAAGSISLCLLARPLDLGAPDGLPVRALFVLISPTIEAHLRLLGGLASALHDRALRDAVLGARDDASLLEQVRRIDDEVFASAEGSP